jgi:formylglycine-generating enzyme required for sulfatase activity
MQTSPWLDLADPDPGEEPAVRIPYALAVEFCDRLTARERDAGRVPDGYRYCLPSEAQWELAARGGGQGRFPHGDDEDGLAAHAVHGDPVRWPAPVASKLPNAFGFHDLAGNVDEWCADAVDPGRVLASLRLAAAVEPLGTSGTHGVVRGGNHRSPAADCRCAARTVLPRDASLATLGFRVALARR